MRARAFCCVDAIDWTRQKKKRYSRWNDFEEKRRHKKSFIIVRRISIADNIEELRPRTTHSILKERYFYIFTRLDGLE